MALVPPGPQDQSGAPTSDRILDDEAVRCAISHPKLMRAGGSDLLTHDPLAKAVGLHLRAVREERGASQTDVAEAAGVTQGALSNYERGIRNVRAVTLLAILDFLECAPADFFGRLEAFVVVGSEQRDSLLELTQRNLESLPIRSDYEFGSAAPATGAR